MKTVYIEDNTPEGKWLLDLIKGHKSVRFEPNEAVKTKSESAWDKAIAAGAVSLDEFGARFKEEIHNAYKA